MKRNNQEEEKEINERDALSNEANQDLTRKEKKKIKKQKQQLNSPTSRDDGTLLNEEVDQQINNQEEPDSEVEEINKKEVRAKQVTTTVISQSQVPFVDSFDSNIDSNIKKLILYVDNRMVNNPDAKPMTIDQLLGVRARQLIPVILKSLSTDFKENYLKQKGKASHSDLDPKDLLVLLQTANKINTSEVSRDPVSTFTNNLPQITYQNISSYGVVWPMKQSQH